MKKQKLSMPIKTVLFICIVIVTAMVGGKVIPKFMIGSVIDIKEPIEVQEGLYVSPDAIDKMTNQELQEFVEEYGDDTVITIDEVGY